MSVNVMDVADGGPKYTARQWDALLHPRCSLVDVDRGSYMCTVVTRAEYNQLYGSSKVAPLYDEQYEIDLITVPIGHRVKIETLSQSLYTFVYRGPTDDGARAIVDIIGGLDMATVIEESVVCNRRVTVGSSFALGNMRTSIVIEFWVR